MLAPRCDVHNLEQQLHIQTFTLKEAAKAAGVSERQLHRAVCNGKLRVLCVGNVVMRDDLEVFKLDFAPTRANGYVRRERNS